MSSVVLLLHVAARNQSRVDSGRTPEVEEEEEQVAASLGCRTSEEAGKSDRENDVVSEVRAASKCLQTAAVDDDDEPATKRRLEALLQLETRARRAIEENFRRVKGFTFLIS